MKKLKLIPFRISTKISISMILLILFSVTFLSVQFYRSFSSELYSQTENYIDDMMMETGKNIELQMNNFTNLIFTLQYDTDVQNYLVKEKVGSLDEYHKYLLVQNMTNAVYKQILFNDMVESVCITTDSGKTKVINKSLEEYAPANIDKNKIYQGKGACVFLNTNRERQYVVVAAQINSLATQKPLGYMVVNIRESYLNSIFNSMEFTRGGNLQIVNQELSVISHADKALLNTKLGSNYQDIISKQKTEGFYVSDSGKNQSFIAYSAIGSSGWYLVATIPTEAYGKTLHVIAWSIFLVAVIVVIVAAFVAVFIANSTYRPIKKLSKSMQSFGEGNFDVKCELGTADEIGILADSFNNMVTNLNDLVEKVYQATVLKQQAELKSLRMQINPHFLYNTLETINWMARINGVSEIGNVAKALGDMMRATINGSDFVRVNEELREINNYLNIQMFRYGDKLNTSIDFSDEILEMYMPKLIIQPLLENAIVHGIENKFGDGHISIRGELENGIAIFTIHDDGVGIPKSNLERLLQENYDIEQEGYTTIGVRNVDKRLKLYYGEQYGLQITSTLNVGTTVTVKFPGLPYPPTNG